MKTILVVNVNSFVDLITNSSSELFVCDTDKSVQTVKEIVEELVKTHDKLEGTNYLSKLWTDVFKEPELAQYTWDLHSVPAELRDEYLRYGDRESWIYGFRMSQTNETEKKLNQKVYDYEHEIRLHEQELNEEEYKRRRKLADDYANKVFKEWGTAKFKAYNNLYKHFLKINNFPQEEIDRVGKIEKKLLHSKKFNYRWPHFYYDWIKFDKKDWKNNISDPMSEILSEFRMYMSYQMRIKKGAILIPTQSDNTAPYDIFDSMDRYLNAEHYHCGY